MERLRPQLSPMDLLFCKSQRGGTEGSCLISSGA